MGLQAQTALGKAEAHSGFQTIEAVAHRGSLVVGVWMFEICTQLAVQAPVPYIASEATGCDMDKTPEHECLGTQELPE